MGDSSEIFGGLGLLEKRASLAEEEAKILGMTKRAAEQGSDLVRRLLAAGADGRHQADREQGKGEQTHEHGFFIRRETAPRLLSFLSICKTA